MPKVKNNPDLLADLNPEQKQAVTHGEGPLLIVAGAGTGKTTVITRRIAWLIEQGLAKPEEILALTFTDKAALEMEERVDKLLPTGYVNIPISTFHAFGERILKDWALEIGLPNNFRVLTATEQWMLVRNNLDKFNLDYYRPLGNPTRFIHALVQHFSRAKDEEVYPDNYLKFAEDKKLNTGAGEYLKKGKRKNKIKVKNDNLADVEESESLRLGEVARAYSVYQQLLLDDGALDFGDLINYPLKLLRERPQVLEYLRKQFKCILVDEFQDTNYAQYELIKLLAAPGNNVTVVGDDDQSIYKFRGASISNILEFKQDYPQAREIFLTTSYRSYQNILDTAYEFIQLNNPYRLEVRLATKGKSLSKKLVAERKGKGDVGYYPYKTAQAEAEGVINKIVELQAKDGASWSDFAILVRANSSAQIFLQALKARQLPFDYVANRGLYNESIILDIISYLKLLDNYHEAEALYRVLNMEPFQMPAEDVAKLIYFANRKTISLYEALKMARTISLGENGIRVASNLLELLEKHTAIARERPASEVYVRVVEDLGINERVAHPALVREASYLTSFYDRLKRFEVDTPIHNLNNFLKYLELELESGEEGQLPQNFEEGPDTVKVITVHSAKGLEWKYVFVVQLVDRRFPSTERREPIELPRELIKEVLPEGDVHLQEERRLFYVGLTRARDGIYLTRAEDYFGKTTRKPSRFLYELGFVSEEEFKAAPTKIKPSLPEIITKGKATYPIPENFSFSSVSAFRKCPLEYKYRYLLRLPTPGAAALSFGITMHRTFEQFLKLWQSRQGVVQGGLFGDTKASGKVSVPTEHELKAIFESSWLDDWYLDKPQKQEYRTVRAPKQLKNFYEEFLASPPKPKFLEQMFKIAMGPYKFTGKIDRIDQAQGGVVIYDYKTGGEPKSGLEKVDKDQLIIYQIAAEEFLREKVLDERYWYLEPNKFSETFIATKEQIDSLKEEYTNEIKKIIEAVKQNSFIAIHKDHEGCKYQHLG
jgi:DNA helicase-2/ATP-dependent DNA helicase PcrA